VLCWAAVTLKRQAVRDLILSTAADLFRLRGYRATTLDDIAARLGMSKASLYTYFRGKEEILAEISRLTIETFSQGLAEISRAPLSPQEKLRQVIRRHVRFVVSHRSFLTVFFSEEASLPARSARALARQKDRYDKALETIVRQGIRRGDFRPVPARLVVYGLLGMVNWLYKWYNPRGPLGPDDIAGVFLSLVEDGLVARRRPGGPALGRRLDRLRQELAAATRALQQV
jgi:TetR/AcrR family transcriptional regulator, cholesterol catabolism regulator